MTLANLIRLSAVFFYIGHALATELPMHIVIETDNPPIHITATLADNATARDFYALLPIRQPMRDYAASETIMENLPNKLSTADAPARYAGQKGDLTYYAPWGNLAIFYTDSTVGSASGLVYIGKITAQVEDLQKLNGAVVTIRPAE